MSETSTVRLHCIRIHNIKDDFKLQADFGDKIKFTFTEEKQLRGNGNFVPFIYTLDLNLKIGDNKQLYVYHENSPKSVNGYHLIISRPRPFTIHPEIHHQEKISQEHKLPVNFDNPNHFLFDIHFSKASMIEPPGISTNYFDDLCLFTYYLLHNQIYYLFDILVDQFRANLSNDNRTFDRNKYNEFFETCNLYMDNISADLETNPTTLKIILCMIGLLTIETKSFDRHNRHANKFAAKIMSYIRKQFDSLLKLLKKDEQLLFGSGLAILLCIELLYSTPDDSDNKLIFLWQISNEKQRQDIANKILAEIYKLNQPIDTNSTWTDLFTIVNPDMIKLQYVYLTTSFETYIMFLTKVSPVYPDSNHFYRKITEAFKDLIYWDNLIIDLQSILFLIKFVQHELLHDHEVTKRLLNEIQHIIKTDQPLKYKINEYFISLDVTIENLENIGYILSLKSKWSILNNIKKDDFLRKSLTKSTSHEYYVKWFKCFLANGQAQDGNNHEQCKQLLKAWTNCFENDYSKFTKILVVIDELIYAFEGSIDNYWLRSYFVDHMIYLCFQQKSVFHIIVDGLLQVKNELFRERFKHAFERKYFHSDQQKSFKEITTNKNPLSKLIELDTNGGGQSMLVHDLIQVVCANIEVTKDALMDDAFNIPTKSTSTYTVLFNDSFRTVPVHIKIIEQLIIMWEEWEKDGFKDDETNTWSELNHDQRQIACDIWNRVGKSTRKTISFEQLIDKQTEKSAY